MFYLIMHCLNLQISFPFCSLKFTFLRYTVRGDQYNNVYLLITIFIIFISDYKERKGYLCLII